MKKLKNILKKGFNVFGYEIKRKNNEIIEQSFDEILKEKITEKNPVIIDVGANNGQSVNRFLELFDNPIIHSFEPITKEFDVLKEKFGSKKNIHLNKLALGEKKETKFLNITKKSENSSFNNINLGTDWIKKRSKEYDVKEENYINLRQKVDVNTLDAYSSEHNIKKIDILKIDTQGYEDKVLSGCLNLINNDKVSVIITEIIFDNVYDKYFSFSDIEKFIIPNNFRMVGIDLINNNLFSGLLFVADVMYFNKKHFKI